MKLLYADQTGRIYDHPDFAPLARTGMYVTDILEEELIPLPSGATLVSLPGTLAIGYDKELDKQVVLNEDYSAVGALLPQGFTRLLLPGYIKRQFAEPLPLFGYTAVVWKNGQFYVAADQTEVKAEWFDPALYPDMKQPVQDILQQYPHNQIYQHLQTCTLDYQCLTSKNTFLGQREGAIPISSVCNAGCVGCISEQPEDSPFPSPQIRMTVKPTVDEMVEVMVHHLKAAGPEGIISFGQGCEGEPTSRGFEMAEAIRKTREQIQTGYINLNTNAGLTPMIREVVRAGLDLMRISIVSAIPEHYNAYYQPRGYTVEDVAASAEFAAKHGVYTSINYLIFPGVTDREEEIEAMVDLINKNGISLIQMRNLNIDPELYLKKIPEPRGEILGMKQILQIFREECPNTRIGSFTHIPEKKKT